MGTPKSSKSLDHDLVLKRSKDLFFLSRGAAPLSSPPRSADQTWSQRPGSCPAKAARPPRPQGSAAIDAWEELSGGRRCHGVRMGTVNHGDNVILNII